MCLPSQQHIHIINGSQSARKWHRREQMELEFNCVIWAYMCRISLCLAWQWLNRPEAARFFFFNASILVMATTGGTMSLGPILSVPTLWTWCLRKTLSDFSRYLQKNQLVLKYDLVWFFGSKVKVTHKTSF